MRPFLVRFAVVLLGALAGLPNTGRAQLVRRAEPFVEPPPAQPAPAAPAPVPPPVQTPAAAPSQPQAPVVTPPPTAVKRAIPVEEPEPTPPVPAVTPPAQPPTADPVKREEPPMLDVKQMQSAQRETPAEPARKAEPTDGEETKPPASDSGKEKEEQPKPKKPEEPPAPKAKLYEPPMEGMLVSMGRVKDRKDLEASWQTLKDAPTIKLEVAAPRGQITDRNGVCLAQNRIAYYLAISFPLINPATNEKIIAFGQNLLSKTNALLGSNWVIPDERFVQHYKDRRWLPMLLGAEGSIAAELTPEQIDKITPLLGKGLVLHPTYVRTYPKLSTACHIVGYTGIRQRLPTGPIADFEPFIEEPMGRSGLEASFENDLRGKPGLVSILFDPKGEKLHEDVLRRPVPGHNVVTTLDYDMQRFAEDSLRKNARNGGAMVIVDVRNGDILTMASNPGYDLNEFVPRVPETRYADLVKDPKTPLLGRAFQGNYFPASTFKVITSLAGLESKTINEDTTFDCSSGYQIGNRTFHNWNRDGEGYMNVVGAIKRSCNTWFYQAAMQIGSNNIINMADRMGFGQPVGLPLVGEVKGFLPTDAFYMQREGHKILPGMLASIAIGQVVTATPLQVAQCMATVADGKNMPKLRLVKQVQDYNDNVVQAWPPEVRKAVDLNPNAREYVVRGMIAVVQGDGGTGKNAQLSGVQVAGKTGTAQWQVFEDESKNRWLAWFTGFLPARNPVYAFAVVYEGSPGEHVSGGHIAAPIVQEVFEKIYKHAKASDPLLAAAKDSADEPVDNGEVASAPKATPVAEAAPPPPPPQPEQPATLGGFFRKLFGKRSSN